MTAILSPSYLPFTPRNEYAFTSSMDVDQAGDDLCALNAQIAALQAQLAILQSRRHALVQTLIIRALTPPYDEKPSAPLVTQLAPELLGYIFELALEPNSLSNVNLLSISNVCKRWRSIAQLTPQLWTNVILTAPTPMSSTSSYFGQHIQPSSESNTDSMTSFLNLLTTWIPRSGALPFHLSIRNRSPTNRRIRKSQVFTNDLFDHRRSMSPVFQQALETLYKHLGRCQSIQVDEDMTDIWTHLFSALRSVSAFAIASNLHTLVLGGPADITASDIGNLPLAAFKIQLPSLHTLDVTCPAAIETLGGLNIDCSQLRILKWRTRGSFCGPSGWGNDEITDLLAQCTHLEELEVDHLPQTHRLTSNLITLPALTKFTIKFTLFEDPAVLFSMIHAPELEELILEQTSPIGHVLGLSGAVGEFLRANANTSVSSHRLRSLKLSGLILKDLDAPLFQALDSVRFSSDDLNLTFTRCFLHDAFVSQTFGVLAVTESAGVIQPPFSRLSTLNLHSTACNPRLLHDVIEARGSVQLLISD
ncbi:hypothetical protein Clacol_005707 [Clathrus columnatus]|uniref:F-box domain-containing protein n=1 Tax=Clathrus columnatus TaxID=1419009 RepID=A0AAV5AA36_9AGAM|nr:hypothetical protein Clacol_005707 [Clathrus columnatus]